MDDIISDCPTFPANARHFDGFIRNRLGVFGVHYGNPNYILDMPDANEAPSPKPPIRNGDFKRPSWISAHHPFLLLLPRYEPFYGPIFSCLNVAANTLPIVCPEIAPWERPRFQLESSLVERWLHLESQLLLTWRTLMDFYGRDKIEGVWLFKLPICYGYTTSFSTRAGMVKSALTSRDAFLPLMAKITMMFILLDGKDSGDWRRAVQRATNAPWQWLDDLEASAVGDMTVERMGGIIDLTMVKNHPEHRLPRHFGWLLPFLLGKHRVPMYFYYGNTFPLKERIPEALTEKGFGPQIAEIAYLDSLPGEVAFSPWLIDRPIWLSCRDLEMLPPPSLDARFHAASPRPALFLRPLESPRRPIETPNGQAWPSSARDSAFPPPDDDEPIASSSFPPAEHPPPEKNSGQRPGETIHQFLERRRVANEKRLEKESSDARQRRLARETVAATGKAPSLNGKHGTRVFIWDWEDGFYIRRHYGRRNADDRWDEFSASQRIYDSFSNEWDLCEALDLDAEPDFAYDDDDDDDDYDDFFLGNNSNVSDDVAPPVLDFPAVPDLPGRDIIENAKGDDAVRVLGDGYVDELKHTNVDVHHGYVAADVNKVLVERFGFRSSDSAPNDGLGKATCLWTIGDAEWRLPARSALPAFLQSLLQATTFKDLPSSLCDLDSLRAHDWPVQVKSLIAGNIAKEPTMVYLLEPVSLDAAAPTIMLVNPVTVLECIRTGEQDTNAIIRHLTWKGVEFHPCWLRETTRTPNFPPWPVALGCRPAGYVPNSFDYGAYVQRRDDFLHSSRGCVALFEGGIVGRIARMVIADFDDKACLEPSEDDLDVGVRLVDKVSGASLWYEALTGEEIELICGVYPVETGQTSSTEQDGAQLKYISWWPLPPAWHTSGLSTGWWSANCERWFQKRLNEISMGSAQLHTNSEWKSKIRYNSTARKVSTKHESLVAEYLAASPRVSRH